MQLSTWHFMAMLINHLFHTVTCPLILFMPAGLGEKPGSHAAIPLRVSRGAQRAIGSKMGATPLGEHTCGDRSCPLLSAWGAGRQKINSYTMLLTWQVSL